MNSSANNSQIPVSVIEGDGIGPEITEAALSILDAAVTKSSNGKRKLVWQKVLAGNAAIRAGQDALPAETLRSLRANKLALKGPLTTPISGGFGSLNVRLRQELDLYVCLRPVKSIQGLPSPLALPGQLDVVIFRENSEDLYTGLEFSAGSPENQKLLSFLADSFPQEFRKIPVSQDVGLGIKPISKSGSQRFIRAAIDWSLQHHRRKLTLVHKGNIMKYTEGAFLQWAYDVAETEYKDRCFTRRQFQSILKTEGKEKAEQASAIAAAQNCLQVTDLIADVAFEQAILQPHTFDVIATTNLNGDYLSDAFAALAGGVGISPSANLNPELGIGLFEANHGSADDLAATDRANPSSLILSGAMLLDFIGWAEAAALVRASLQKVISSKQVTFDLARLLPDAAVLGTRAFTQAILSTME